MAIPTCQFSGPQKDGHCPGDQAEVKLFYGWTVSAEALQSIIQSGSGFTARTSGSPSTSVSGLETSECSSTHDPLTGVNPSVTRSRVD